MSYTASLKYEARVPNADHTDWASSPSLQPAPDLLVAVFRGETLIDARTTDASGMVTLEIPASPSADDQVVAFLMHPNDAGTSIVLAVAEPDLADGEAGTMEPPGPEPQFWMWSIDPVASPSGSTLIITEALGSGAVRVFDALRYVYSAAEAQYGIAGSSLVAWLRMNTSWTCGQCYATLPTSLLGFDFDSQLFISGAAADAEFWADPVTAHELGHWVMATYGRSPNEGGPHCMGVPTLPGQAWSEGWATAFSSLLRENSLYYDKQDGTMFWLDLALRQYSESVTWKRPSASGGLFQPMDENEVAAMLWGLGTDPAVGSTRVFSALSTSRLIVAPFARGYTRRSWRVDSRCNRYQVVDTGDSAPMFADFLDALRCQGTTMAAVDTATNPSVNYPYPSSQPLCD